MASLSKIPTAQVLVIAPNVSNGHTVLGQGSCLVRGDDCGGSDGVNLFQLLQEDLLPGHTASNNGQLSGDGGWETWKKRIEEVRPTERQIDRNIQR